MVQQNYFQIYIQNSRSLSKIIFSVCDTKSKILRM